VSQDGPYPTSTIWLVPTMGGAARRLATSEATHWSPRWSPDGRWIAFLSDRRQRGTSQLYLLALAGGEAIRLTEQLAGVQALAWAPDGRKLAFTTIAAAPERSGAPDVLVVDADLHPTSLWVVDLPDDPAALGAGVLP